jgi:hypothetical protein
VEEVQPHPGRSRRGEGREGHLPLRDQGREADLPGPPQTKQESEGHAGPPPLPAPPGALPSSPTSLPPGRPLLKQPDQPFNSLPESSVSATPPGGSPGP